MAIPKALVSNKKKKRNKPKDVRIGVTQEVLKEIGRIKGLSLYKVCDLLKIPKDPSRIKTKEVSGYNARAKEYLRQLKKNGK